MSLMHLLSVSPTFSGARNKADDYKVRSALPKFAPVRRPVSLTPKKQPERNLVQPSLFEQKKPTASASQMPSAGAVGGTAPAVEPAQAAPAAAAPPIETAKPAEAPKAEAPAVATPNVFNAPKEEISDWKKKRTWKTRIKEFFHKRGRRPTGKSEQAELALEHVTVVRNDLSDADLEVVSKKAPANSEEALSLRDKREMAGLAWTRLTARFLNPDPNEKTPKAQPQEAGVVQAQPAEEVARTQ